MANWLVSLKEALYNWGLSEPEYAFLSRAFRLDMLLYSETIG